MYLTYTPSARALPLLKDLSGCQVQVVRGATCPGSNGIFEKRSGVTRRKVSNQRGRDAALSYVHNPLQIHFLPSFPPFSCISSILLLSRGRNSPYQRAGEESVVHSARHEAGVDRCMATCR